MTPQSNNRLSGSIPSCLSNLTKLTFLDVSRNVLSGTLPPELGNISTSLQLIVFDNNITGTVPSGTFGPCPTGILTHRVLTCPGLHALPSV